MIKYARENNMTLEDVLMHTISHELIHQIIFDWHNRLAETRCFDKVCMRKYKQMKYWIGGVGATKEGEKL